MKACRDCNTAQPALNSVRCEGCNESRRQIRLYKAEHKVCYNCDKPASAGYRSCVGCRERRRREAEDRRARGQRKKPGRQSKPKRTNLNEGICLWCSESFKTHLRCRECKCLIHWYGASDKHDIDPRYVVTHNGRICLRCQGIFTPEVNETEPIECQS